MAGLRFSGAQCVAVLTVGLVSVVLALFGYGIGALVLISGAGVVAMARRHEPAKQIQVEQFLECGELPHSCEVVWALIKPAERAHLLEPSIRRGYHVPGTPVGLGERQAFELLDGTTTVVEVVEYEPNRRAVTRQLSPPPTQQIRLIHSVEPVDGGCVITIGYEVEVPAGLRVDRQAEPEWHSATGEHIERIRRILEATDPR